MFSNETELAAYRTQFVGVSVPRVCERVMFTDRSGKTDRYRVSGYYCPTVFVPSAPDNYAGQVIDELLLEEIGRLKGEGRVKVRCSTPEEATHVAISGVCGFLVRIDRVQGTGELVDWTPERIAQEEADVRRRAQVFPISTVEASL